jgi:hypothetical protein
MKTECNKNDGATRNYGPSTWDSFFITYAYDSYEVYNTLINISNVRSDLCAWHVSVHLGYSNIYDIWVSTTFRVRFEGNHLSRGRCSSERCAAAVQTRYMLTCISDINPSIYIFEVLRHWSTERLGDICTWEKPIWLTLFDESDCNNGISSESYMMGIHWPFCTRPPRFVNIICTYVNCASLGAPALDDDIALPPSIRTLRLGLRFRVRPGKEVRWKHT